MFGKGLKLFSVICLLAAQFIVAGHVHYADEALPEEHCVYCQAAAELSGMDAPSAVVLDFFVRIEAPRTILKADIFSDQASFTPYHSRAPPAA